MEMPEKKKKNTQHFPNLLIPLLILVSSFLISHPLFFLKLLSFLSPLLITTLLILLFTSYKTLLGKLRVNSVNDNGHIGLEGNSDENEVYKIFFEALSFQDGSGESEELVDKFLICADGGVSGCSEKKDFEEEGEKEESSNGDGQAEKTLEELFHEKEEGGCEGMELKVVVEEKEVKEEVKEEVKGGELGSEAGECGSRAWRNSRRLSSSLKIFEKSSGGLGEEKVI